MHSTRIRDVVGLAVAAGVAVWLLTRHFYPDFPAFQWFVPLSLPLLAIVEVVLGSQLRARIQRRPRGRTPRPPVEPLVAARSVALAKASAIVGAVTAGAWCGLLSYVVPRASTLAAAHDDTFVAAIGAAGAIALVAAALWLEHCCKTPESPDDADLPRETERQNRG